MALNIQELLGENSDLLLNHTCKTIDKSMLTLPSSTFVDEAFSMTNRSPQVMRNLQAIYNHGRLAGTGYVSILPVDQGIEHSAAASFAPNPRYFDPANIVELAIEAGCNGVASTYGVLAQCSRKYAHKIPFIVKLNHNEFLTYPNSYNQIMFGSVDKDGNPIYTGEAVDQDFDIGELMGGICTYTLGAVLHESGGKKYFNQTLKDCAPKHEAIPVPDVPLELFGLSYEGGNDVKALEAFSKFNPIMNTLTLGENYDKSGLKADFDAYFKSLGSNSTSGGEGSASPSASTGEKAATSVDEFDDADGDDDMSMFD